jgi:hypothetical protein
VARPGSGQDHQVSENCGFAIAAGLELIVSLRMTKFPHSVASGASKPSAAVVLMITLITPLSSIAEDNKIATVGVRLIPSLRVISDGLAIRSVVLDVFLRNTSDSPIFFGVSCDDWDYQIELLRPDGHPVDLTNYGKCMLPYPSRGYSNSKKTLEPFARDYAGKVELNKLFRFDQIGVYRMVVRRSVLRLADQQQDWHWVSSDPLFFFISSPVTDSSPPMGLEHCRI